MGGTQIKENFWPQLTLHRAVSTEALQHAGGVTTPWKSVVKLLASPGSPPVPCPPPGMALCISTGRGGRDIDLENGGSPFLVCCHGIWEDVHLNSTDSTFIFIHLEVLASKEELIICFSLY